VSTSPDWALLDGIAQAELVRSGAVSAEELVRLAIERIERVDPRLNAVVIERFERALAEARAPLADGPFAGVPFLLKDAVCHSAGDPYHFGMRALKEIGWVERSDTTLARRFRAAGLVTLGKTNTPEMAGSATTEPLAYGPTRNPWDLDRSPGGSSGGAGAAVAAGLVAVAHGNDMGGSIRIPAAACGVVGLKPSRGRVSLGPELGEAFGSSTHEHVLTRSVRDSAAVLDAIAGYEPGDPYTAPPPHGTFLQAALRDPGRLRVGVLRLPPALAIATACQAAVDATAALLDRLGHELVSVEVAPLWDELQGGEAGAALATRELERLEQRVGQPLARELLEPATAYLVELGASVSATAYLADAQVAQQWARRVSASWRAQCDVLLTPTLPELPPPLGKLAPTALPPAELLEQIGRLVTFTAPFNGTGEPAISLPVWWTDGGQPVGIQLVGGYGEDAGLLSLAGQLERSAPWHARYATLE